MAPDSLQTLIDRLSDGAEAPAVIAFNADGPETWSRGDLGHTARRFAAGLVQRDGCGPQRIGLLGPEPTRVDRGVPWHRPVRRRGHAAGRTADRP